MKKILVLILLASLCFVVPVGAQDADAAPGPGLGGMIIDGSTAGDPATFNPLIGGDTASSAVYYAALPGDHRRQPLHRLGGAQSRGRDGFRLGI